MSLKVHRAAKCAQHLSTYAYASGFVLRDNIIAVHTVPMTGHELTTPMTVWSYTTLLPVLLLSPKSSHVVYSLLEISDERGASCSGWLRLCMPGQRQRKLVNVVDTFQAQRGDKSRATPQTIVEMAHSLWCPYAGNWVALVITLGRRWKSRGQVGQTMDVTGGLIYYLYLLHDSSSSHLIWLRRWRGLCYY